MVMAGHVMKKMRTLTEVQGYAPDWSALEEHFPAIQEMPDYSKKWAYIEQRCLLSKADAEFVKAHRPKLPDSHRVIKDKVITDDFVEDIVDALVAETWSPTFKFHAWGTGVGAEAAGDAALGTEGAETRATGTHVEGATSKTYKSVGTLTCNATPKAITEHGLLDQEAVGGILADRTKFSAINVVEGNQIEFTFNAALTSGG